MVDELLATVIDFLIRIVQIPEVIGLLGASAIPFIAILYRHYLEKRPSNGPTTITLTVSGESVKIKFGEMSDEEIEQAMERLRDLAAKANASTSTT